MAVCDDCGAPIVVKGKDALDEVRAHYELAHPGMPRFRWTEAPGKSFLACALCDEKPMDARRQYSTSKGQDKDPIDRFGAHLETHQEAD